MSFTPDYTNIVKAVYRKQPDRLPLYEHIVSDPIIERITGKEIGSPWADDQADKINYFRHICHFHRDMGYDAFSFEVCAGAFFPGSGALGGYKEPAIHNRADFDRYPWDEVMERYFQAASPVFEALAAALPPGMKAIGGVGNGVFECVQDIAGYTNLCYIAADDPDLCHALFERVGAILCALWEKFLRLYSDPFCILRFGDDLGFKSNSLLSAEDIRALVIPQYEKIVRLVHSHRKPFLLHSCGNIFNVMNDLIDTVRIDAKHSNEDQIAPFPVWLQRYGDRIACFGGMDTDAVCRLSHADIRAYVIDVLEQCKGYSGFAFGTGNAIADYVPYENYAEMVLTARKWRGDA